MLYNMGKVHKAACPSVQFKVDSRVFKHQFIIVSCLIIVLCATALVGAFISKKALVPFSNIVKTTYSIYYNAKFPEHLYTTQTITLWGSVDF